MMTKDNFRKNKLFILDCFLFLEDISLCSLTASLNKSNSFSKMNSRLPLRAVELHYCALRQGFFFTFIDTNKQNSKCLVKEEEAEVEEDEHTSIIQRIEASEELECLWEVPQYHERLVAALPTVVEVAAQELTLITR